MGPHGAAGLLPAVSSMLSLPAVNAGDEPGTPGLRSNRGAAAQGDNATRALDLRVRVRYIQGGARGCRGRRNFRKNKHFCRAPLTADGDGVCSSRVRLLRLGNGSTTPAGGPVTTREPPGTRSADLSE